MAHAYEAEKESRQYYETKYSALLKKFQQLLLTEHEKSVALQQATHQVDHLNSLIADLLKEKRERNWLLVDNQPTDNLSAV
jgi:hypothetical protein